MATTLIFFAFAIANRAKIWYNITKDVQGEVRMDQRTQQRGTARSNTSFLQPRTWPGQQYWILLTITIILLVAFTAAFFVLLLSEGDGFSRPSGADAEDYINNGGINKGNESTEKNNTLTGVDIAQLTTKPSISNYISKSSYVNPVGVINSNNTILIEIGKDFCNAIAEKDADAKIYPASMTKVMSLVVACENLNTLDKKLTVSKETVQYMTSNGGSGVGLIEGEELTVNDCLYLTSYQSDTVAILTLAEYIAGSEAKFVDMMNQKARELGLNNTHFSNSTGLHDENNYTTCREMAAIMTYALDNPYCKKLLTSYEGYDITIKAWDKETETYVDKECTFYSTWYSGRFKDNPKLDTVVVKAAKTGYTDEAGVCLVSYAESKASGRRYINVIVGKPKGSGLSETKSTEEVKKIYNTYAE